MVALAILVVVLVALLAYGSTRTNHDRGPGPDRPSDLAAGPARWAAAGLVTDEQARAITRFERDRTAPRSRVSPAIEALAYVGGVLLSVGAAMLVGQFWDRIGTAGHLGFVGAAAVVAGVVGTVVGEDDAVAWRLRGFLWAISAGGVGAFVGIGVWEVLDRSGEPVAFATATAVALSSAAYWWLRDRPLQHALTLVGIAVALGVAIAWTGRGNVAAWIGLALWLLGVAWAGSAWRRLLPPAIVGCALGALLTLVAAGFVVQRYETIGPVVGLATAAVWVAVGIAFDEGLALAPGVFGTFVYLPWSVGRIFGDALGAPAVVMLSGALLLGVVVVLLRRRRGQHWFGGSGLLGPTASPRR